MPTFQPRNAPSSKIAAAQMEEPGVIFYSADSHEVARKGKRMFAAQRQAIDIGALIRYAKRSPLSWAIKLLKEKDLL